LRSRSCEISDTALSKRITGIFENWQPREEQKDYCSTLKSAEDKTQSRTKRRTFSSEKMRLRRRQLQSGLSRITSRSLTRKKPAQPHLQYKWRCYWQVSDRWTELNREIWKEHIGTLPHRARYVLLKMNVFMFH